MTDLGLTVISLKMTLGSNTTWQNFTVQVAPVDHFYVEVIPLILSLLFCFAFLFIGFKNNIFMILAGIIWIITSLTIFITYGQLFLLVGLGVGIIGMLEGGLRYGS
jgi:hypothetical protein